MYPTLDTNKGGIRCFIQSLRQFNKTCTIVVLMNTCPPEIAQFFNKYNVKFILGYNDNLMFTRFIIYYQIISENSIFEKILMSDMNDVIFQGNPFDIILDGDKLYIAQEGNCYNDKTNSSSQLNMNWIKNTSGLNKLPKLINKNYLDKNVVCAGTIFGNRLAVNTYLEWYIEVQKSNNIRCNDQGLLNIYAYEFNKHNVTILNYDRSLILTLDRIDFNKIDKNNSGFLLNSSGVKYIIIHQIDRCGYNNLEYLKKTIIGE